MVRPYLNTVNQTGKKRREMEINEKMLMHVDWSADLKLACYELQQIRPLADTEIIRETAQVMEHMLQAVCGQSEYPYSNFAAFMKKQSKPRASEAERAETKEQVAAMKRLKLEEAQKEREEQEK